MDKFNVTLTISLTVHDPEVFRKAARERAVQDGIDPSDFSDASLSACAIMLLDPGKSPPGSSIEDSSATDDAPVLSTFTCDNCDWSTTDRSKLRDIKHLEQRVDEGGPMPSGECPECGALCYTDHAGDN